MAGRKNVHVVPREGGWAVRRADAERDSSRHGTQREAMEAGRETALRDKVELVIHDKEGPIQDSDSYGHDPNPARDLKH
ncbi:MAG: DUF2188 domain-containing protein [Gemmatimonadaceae bacterium]